MCRQWGKSQRQFSGCDLNKNKVRRQLFWYLLETKTGKRCTHFWYLHIHWRIIVYTLILALNNYHSEPEAKHFSDMVTITNARFHLTDNVNILVGADLDGAWAILPAGKELLPVPGAVVNREQWRTRMVMPVPHQYAAIILEAYANGSLTWRWMHEHVASPILADPAQMVAYKPLVDYITISSTKWPGVSRGPERSPQTEAQLAGVITTPAIQDLAMAVARSFLPGLRELASIGAQLNLLNNQQAALQQAIIQGQQETPVTLATKYQPLLGQVLCINEVVMEQELTPYWTQFASTKVGSRLGALEGIFLEIAYACTPVLMAPIVPLAFMPNISNGQFVGGLNDVKTGLSIFHIHPANAPNQQQLNERNCMYTATAMGAGTAQMSTITMMLADDAIRLPDSSKEFRGYLEG